MAAGAVFIIGFYDKTMNLLFHPSWLHAAVQERVPDWLPPWLFL